MDDRRINWWQILITALITGIVTVVTGMALYKLQEREPLLTYSTIETIPFSGSNKVIGIYNIKILNEGKKYINDVVAVIKLPEAKIDQFHVTANPANAHSEQVNDNVLTQKLSGLNPAEEVTISILASAAQLLPKRPEIALRATGISGVEKTGRKEVGGLRAILPAMMGAFAGLLSLLSLTKVRSLLPFKLLRYVSENKHSGNQRDVIAYICNITELQEDEEHYRNIQTKVEYWSEADRISNKAINSNSEDYGNKVIKMLKLLTDYASMAEDSQAIIFYNIARIAAKYSNADEKKKYLDWASKLAPKIIEKRLLMDRRSSELLSHTATPSSN